MFDINNHINGKVHIESEGRHRSLVSMDGEPKIILNPSWEGSWLLTPKPKGNNTIGYWPPQDKIPRGCGEYYGAC